MERKNCNTQRKEYVHLTERDRFKIEGLLEGKKDASEIARLTAERDRLLARVAALEEDGRVMSGLTEEVETRLDGAISEIRQALAR